MIKKLTQIGNSLGLILDRPILELLHIDRNTELEVQTDGQALVIRPSSKDRRTRVKEASERVMKTHHRTLKRLAE
jgi:antitoxin component of MazEF toxin-antitoxin module